MIALSIAATLGGIAAGPSEAARRARRRVPPTTTLPPSTAAPTTTLPPKPTGPPPELVLTIRDPFRGPVPKEETQFALYRNGSILFRDGNDIREASLVGAELAAARRALAPKPDFWILDGFYESQTAADSRSVLISAWQAKRHRTVSVADDPLLGPDAFVDLYERIVAYRPALAPVWEPPRYELLLAPFPFDKKTLPAWPRGWPTTNSVAARRIGLVVKVQLSPAQATLFRSKFAQFPAVLIEGKTWAYALRVPFPTEEAWVAN